MKSLLTKIILALALVVPAFAQSGGQFGNGTAASAFPDCSDTSSVFSCNVTVQFGSAAQFQVSTAGRINKYNNTNLSGIGLAYFIGTAENVSTQNGSIGSTNLSAGVPSTGQYEVSVYVDERAPCVTVGSGKVVVTVGWTDASAARSQTLTLNFDTATTTTSFANAVIPFFSNSASAVTISTTYTACTSGTATYDLHAMLYETQ